MCNLRTRFDVLRRRASNRPSAESLRNREKSIGASLGRDQAGRDETHLRGGEIGKWRQYYDEADVKFVEHALSEFGLSLTRFVID